MRGTRSRLKLDYSHQKRLLRLFDEHSEVFCEATLHKKCGVFEACKKAQGFFDTLRASEIRRSFNNT